MANQTGRPVATPRKLVAAVMGTIAVFVMALGLGMSSWGVALFGLAVLVLSIGLGVVNVVRRGARAWVSGTAEVRAISPAPTSSAVYGRAEIVAVVVAPGLPTSEVTLREPRVPVVKWPAIGDTLPVTVDVDDMRRVRINWDEASPRDRGQDPPPPPMPDYGDLPDEVLDEEQDDDILGDVEDPPWVNRNRQWAEPEEEEPPPPPGPAESPVVVRDTPAGPVVEGEFVDHNEVTQQLPRRAAAGAAAAGAAAAGAAAGAAREAGSRPSPRPRNGGGGPRNGGGSATATAEPLVEETVAPAEPIFGEPVAAAPSQRAPHPDDELPVDLPLDEPLPADLPLDESLPVDLPLDEPLPGEPHLGEPHLGEPLPGEPHLGEPRPGAPAAEPSPHRRPEPTMAATAAAPSPATTFPTAPEPVTPPPHAPEPTRARPTAPPPVGYDDIDLPLDGEPGAAPEEYEPEAAAAMAEGLIAPPVADGKPTGPVEVPPVEVAPVEVPPVEVAPVEVAPVEVAPVEVAPVAGTASAAPESRATTKFVANAAHEAEAVTEPLPTTPPTEEKHASAGVMAGAAAAAGAVAAAAAAAFKKFGHSDKGEHGDKSAAPETPAAPAGPSPMGSPPAWRSAAGSAPAGSAPAGSAPAGSVPAGSSAAAPASPEAGGVAPASGARGGAGVAGAAVAGAAVAGAAVAGSGAGGGEENPWAAPPGKVAGPVRVEPDERVDDVITAYPSARPGPAGAIYGVGITVLVTDLGRSVAFYRDTLGFYEIDGGDGSAVLASGDTRVVLRAVSGLGVGAGRLIFLNLEVGDVEAVYHELLAKGVTFEHPPQAVNRGHRLELWSATFHDPDEHNIAITQWRAIR